MSRRLDERGTRELLIELPNNYEARVEDVLATALAVSFRRWTGQRALRIDFEADVHSAPMDGLNITNTVGWFAVRYPMTLTLPESTEAGAQLKAIKEQLRAHSSRAAGFDRPDNLGTGDAAASVCFRYHSEGGPVPSRPVRFEDLPRRRARQLLVQPALPPTLLARRRGRGRVGRARIAVELQLGFAHTGDRRSACRRFLRRDALHSAPRLAWRRFRPHAFGLSGGRTFSKRPR